jgi:predicted DCC family thiol-disulfide oxidoreductase YuxK
MSAPSDTPVLLYDGDCGFCAGSVQFVLRHEPPSARSALRFAPLQSAFGEGVRAAVPMLAQVDSVVWHDPRTGRTLVRSDAALAVLRHLGGAWRVLAVLGGLVPRLLRDGLYDAIARRRFALAARACLLPHGDQRARFLG